MKLPADGHGDLHGVKRWSLDGCHAVAGIGNFPFFLLSPLSRGFRTGRSSSPPERGRRRGRRCQKDVHIDRVCPCGQHQQKILVPGRKSSTAWAAALTWPANCSMGRLYRA